MKVSDILRERPRPLVSLPPSATPVEAATLMSAENVGAVLVRDDRGRLLGVLSERNLALAIAACGARLFRIRIGELMAVTRPTAAPGDAIRDVMRVMTERRARHIPVLDGETLVGVVSVGDLLKARLAEKMEEIAVLQDLARVAVRR
jgi:CBS domain-containing protein